MTAGLLPLELALGFMIGVSLGLLGGGGSILTVPALVYLLGQSPQTAVTTSLAIVGINSAVGAFFHHRRHTCNWSVAAIFGTAGMITAFLAAGLSRLLSPALIMVLFALLMFSIGIMMVMQKQRVPVDSSDACRTETPKLWVIILSGAGVGLLTGILGVGGGFLVVPALMMLVRLPMVQAVGTSLAIIAANSFAGLLGHLVIPLDLWLTITFAAAGIAGTFAGAKVVHRLPVKLLRQLFAGFVIILSVFLFIDNVPKLLG